MYVSDLLTCLILLCLIVLARPLCFLARLLSLHHPSKASRSFSLAYAAHMTGSSAAMMERVQKVSPQSPIQLEHCICILSSLELRQAKDLGAQ